MINTFQPEGTYQNLSVHVKFLIHAIRGLWPIT